MPAPGFDSAAERRSIERALHDDVQQKLIGIAVQIQLARELLTPEQTEAQMQLEEIRREVHDTLNRVRAIAGMIYSAVLDARGLGDALRETARAREIRALVETDGLGRLPSDVEAAVYFCCRAVLERAEPASSVMIVLRRQENAVLLDINGGDETGVAAARHIAEAAGGVVAVEQTHLTATIPLI